ncbi:MAG: TetR/AcrR family transcriptional regulator [Bryobacter sp.]|nr:TetR/AcrR family transcriptional regulator [Bryobacter sp.]
MLSDRREAYRESLREDILDAARQLFSVHGFEATSIRAIAEKVGASPGILYHYFEDKQALMAHLVRETFRLLSARLEAIRTDQAPAPDRLRRGLRAYIDFGLQFPHHYTVLFVSKHNLEDHPRILDAFQNEGMQTFGCLEFMCREVIENDFARGDLKDHRELAQSLWASIHGLVSLQISSKGFPWVEQSRLIERHLDVLLAGTLKKI